MKEKDGYESEKMRIKQKEKRQTKGVHSRT